MYRHKPRFLHIGYPKSASTSLQYGLFHAHPEIYFLGWGNLDHPTYWISDPIAAFMEVDVRMGKSHTFDPERGFEAFKPHLHAADHDDTRNAVCLSWESLCFTLVYDTDVYTKACRTFDLLGYSTKVIVVLRNQLSLIRSMYMEMVRGGYSKPFREYLEFLYDYRFTGLTEDLFFDNLLRIYGDLFGYEHVMIVTLEEMAENIGFQLLRIQGYMGLEKRITEIGRKNASEDLHLLEALRRVNADIPHNFGDGYFGYIDAQKIEGYWRREGTPPGARAKYSAQIRAVAMERARATLTDDTPELDTAYPEDLRRAFHDLYAPHNRTLMDTWGVRQLSRLGYPL